MKSLISESGLSGVFLGMPEKMRLSRMLQACMSRTVVVRCLTRKGKGFLTATALKCL